MGFLGIGILSWVMWLPFVGSLILIFFPKNQKEQIKYFANFWSVVCLGVTLVPLLKFDKSLRGLQFIENYQWIPTIGAKYQLGVDGFSLIMIVLTSALGFLAILSSWSAIEDRLKEYYAFLLMLQTGMIGTFLAADMFLFYVFWEVMLVPMYFLIGIWGSERRLYSAIKFFLYTLLGSVVMLLAILKLYFIFPDLAASAPKTYFEAAKIMAEGNAPMMEMLTEAQRSGATFNIWAMQAIGSARLIPLGLQALLFGAFTIGFAVKIPMFPLHTWLPDAHTDAPTAGSVILAGVLLKMGTYGFLRFNLPILPDASQDPRIVGVIAPLAIIGIIYGALCAMAQKDMKRLVAYSSVSHLGFAVLGIFALNGHGVSGSIMHQINHGISTGALFLLVGVLYERRHTRLIEQYSGLAQQMPNYAVVFMIMLLSSIGLPLLNGFIGEFLILRGTLEANGYWAMFGGLGIVLGAAYMLWLYQRIFFGEVQNESNRTLKDLSVREWAYLLPLVVFAFAIGIYPKPILDYIQEPARIIVKQVKHDYFNRPALTDQKAESQVEEKK
ncbi:MAG: NADH-quinone oxidoreductase subunit M [Blastocatellia bacterium]|nr:NADH-quinone oxidoreductase subunit M [Blastocatellia bacterium]